MKASKAEQGTADDPIISSIGIMEKNITITITGYIGTTILGYIGIVGKKKEATIMG